MFLMINHKVHVLFVVLQSQQHNAKLHCFVYGQRNFPKRCAVITYTCHLLLLTDDSHVTAQ